MILPPIVLVTIAVIVVCVLIDLKTQRLTRRKYTPKD